GHLTALPPGHRKPHHQYDQPDLQDEAEDRREAAQAGEQSAAEQEAKQAGAQKAGRKTTEQATPVEETSARAIEQAAARRARAGAAGLCKGTVERLSRVRRRVG